MEGLARLGLQSQAEGGHLFLGCPVLRGQWARRNLLPEVISCCSGLEGRTRHKMEMTSCWWEEKPTCVHRPIQMEVVSFSSLEAGGSGKRESGSHSQCQKGPR